MPTFSKQAHKPLDQSLMFLNLMHPLNAKLVRILCTLPQQTFATSDFPEVVLSFRTTKGIDTNAVYCTGYFATEQTNFLIGERK